MEYVVVGKKSYSYVSKKDGKTRPCVRFYLTYLLTGEGCVGLGTESVFLAINSDDDAVRFGSITSGDVVKLLFNKFGTCIDLVLTK